MNTDYFGLLRGNTQHLYLCTKTRKDKKTNMRRPNE